LLGRAIETAELARVLAAVRDGLSGVLVLRGDAGIGKTALLEWAAGQAHGVQLAQAAGLQAEMGMGFAGLHQLLVPFLGGLEQLPGPQRQALGSAFGLVAGSAPDRFLVGLAVLTLLTDAAAAGPVLCLPVQPLIAAFLTAYTSGSPLSGPAAALTAALRRAQQAPAIIEAKVPDASFVSESAPWLDKLADQAGADLAAVQALLAQTRGDRAAVAADRSQMDALVTAAAGIAQVVAPGVYEQLSDFAQTETGRFLSPGPTTVAPAAGRQLLAAAMANTITFTVTGLAPGQLDAQVTAVAPAGWQATVVPSAISLRSGNRTVQTTIQLHVTPPASAAGTTGNVGVSVAVDGQGTVTAQAEASVAALPAASYPDLVLGAHPSGYWRLDDAGATEADSSGNGNTGHDVGPVVHGQPGALAGSGDTAVQLDGGYVDVPNSPTVALTGPFTIEAWVKTTVTGQQQGIIEKYNTPSPDGFGLRIDADGRLDAFVSSNTASQLVQGATVVTPDVWHLVVATGDGTSLKIYLDGFEDASLSTTLLPQPGQLDLRLGARGDDTNYRLQGDLDEVAIYPSALSLGQIQAQYLAGAYGSASP
jgi:hypothetical protein